MKKFLKVLAATAALASVVPFKIKADDNSGSVEALLWKANWTLDPDYQSDPDVNITFGFNNPFAKGNPEDHLFADELVVDYCCDNTLVHDCGNIPDCPECDCDCDCDDECDCDCDCGCGEADTACDCGCTE